jgi:phosphohistidine phosphatase
MILLLVRHADAGNRDPAQWPDDRMRPLTDKGRKVQTKVAKALGKLGLVPELIVTSPWTRAAQTAEVMQQALGVSAPIQSSDALAADPNPKRLDADVGTRGRDAIVAAVGHSPWIEEWAALLLTGTSHALRVDFPKSGVLAMEIDRIAPGTGTLRFFLRPKLL